MGKHKVFTENGKLLVYMEPGKYGQPDRDALPSVPVPIVVLGTAAPTITPQKVGDFFIDTTNKNTYVAQGTSSSADWTRLVPSTMASQELTVTGDINALTREVLLNHDTTPVVATKAAAPASDWMQVKNVSSGGTAAHQAVLTSGTWDGTNNIATLDEPGEGFVVLFDANGDGTVVVNTGGVVFSS